VKRKGEGIGRRLTCQLPPSQKEKRLGVSNCSKQRKKKKKKRERETKRLKGNGGIQRNPEGYFPTFAQEGGKEKTTEGRGKKDVIFRGEKRNKKGLVHPNDPGLQPGKGRELEKSRKEVEVRKKGVPAGRNGGKKKNGNIWFIRKGKKKKEDHTGKEKASATDPSSFRTGGRKEGRKKAGGETFFLPKKKKKGKKGKRRGAQSR